MGLVVSRSWKATARRQLVSSLLRRARDPIGVWRSWELQVRSPPRAQTLLLWRGLRLKLCPTPPAASLHAADRRPTRCPSWPLSTGRTGSCPIAMPSAPDRSGGRQRTRRTRFRVLPRCAAGGGHVRLRRTAPLSSQRLYDNEDGILDAFGRMWQLVAARLKPYSACHQPHATAPGAEGEGQATCSRSSC